MKTVALIGRPNVGKSTLFNRLIGRREAIETPVAGTTRDRLYGEVFWRSERFELIDVAGVETAAKDEIKSSTQEGVEIAIESADLVLFLVDWNDKDNEIDKLVARKLRATKKPVILVINKADNLERQTDLDIFKRLGNFDMVPVSAVSGVNTGDLLDTITEKLKSVPDIKKSDGKKSDISLVIMGRPNAGKSTLLNSIIGEKRAVISAEPGTTRDIVSYDFKIKDKSVRLYDTAGIRRRGKIEKDTIESFSTIRAWRALTRADIALVVVDAGEGLTAGDTHIIGDVIEQGKGIVLVMNKIDIWEENQQIKIQDQISLLQRKLNFAPWLPVVFISAKDQINIKPIMNQILAVQTSRTTTIEQRDLDAILEYVKNNNMQLAYVTSLKQKKNCPPIFEITYKGKSKPHETQIRYLENKIRDAFPLRGTPIFIDYAGKNRKD